MLTAAERIELITNRITQALQPEQLDVQDESAQHIGHAGAQSGAGHFAVAVKANAFTDKSLVDCHRMVYEAIGDAMHSEIHALRIAILK